ncbi:MAG: S8 family serine peptidase [Caldilineaceae bacterium]
MLSLFSGLCALLFVHMLWPTPSMAVAAPALQDDPKNEVLDASAWQAWRDMPDEYKRKVDPRLLAELRGEIIPAHLGGDAEASTVPPAERKVLQKTRFLVYLRQTANLKTTLNERVFVSAIQQRAAVFSTLVATAQQSQMGVRAALNAKQQAGDVIGYQSFHIVNAIAVEGGLATLVDLARRYDVERIVANYPVVPLWAEPPTPAQSAGAAPQDQVASAAAPGDFDPQLNWNLERVGANRVWNELGVRGEGAVVAGFDTGVYFQHPSLANNYRGNNGGALDHHYNWFEPDSKLYVNGDLGPSVSNAPTDCGALSSHGTHTMGTMVGASTATSGSAVGMAPAARWIAIPGICDNTMPGGIGDDIGGLKAFQWLLCPTDLSGKLSTADCSKAPDVVNNSWGSANPVNNVFRPAIQALRAAGIAPVFASGNPFAGEGSIGSPASAPEAITVGATDDGDKVADFSGRGPSFYAGELKPELSAPGVSVRSSVGNESYDTNSGTSMAAPHVAGLVALIVSADLQDGVRDFSVDEIERFMQFTAVDLGEPGPDYEFGYGRINAYEAVRWALSAGDLRGAVRNAQSGAPILHANVRGKKTGLAAEFTTPTDANGIYSVTVPAGSYDVTVDAWGYVSATFRSQVVFPDTLSVADFRLTPLQTATVHGVVRTGQALSFESVIPAATGQPVVGARVYVAEHPDMQSITDSSGAYSLTLPQGMHTLVIEAAGHRVISETVSAPTLAADADIVLDFAPDAAPAILIVDADAHGGWFYGWPVHTIFEEALTSAGYKYDVWSIEYTNFFDKAQLEDGSIGYGIPRADTLHQYDVVIWVHRGCGFYYCNLGGSPREIGAEDALINYLDSGGRLILSGQDIGRSQEEPSARLFGDYLYATLRNDSAADAGDSVSGADFLDGLKLDLTNAALYGFQNGSFVLSPDAISIKSGEGSAFPILNYDNGQGVAGLAVNPCSANYRAVYLPVGYENLGPRGENRSSQFPELMARSIKWILGHKPPLGLSVTALDTLQKTGEAGDKVIYQFQLINKGAMTATVDVHTEGALWPTRIFDGAIASSFDWANDEMLLAEILGPVTLAPCELRIMTAAVDVPRETQNGDADAVTIRATMQADGPITDSFDLLTRAFNQWRIEPSMPTPRSRLAIVATPGDIYYYAIGGWVEDGAGDATFGSSPSGANERYNTCTQRWETMSPLPAGLANLAAVMLNGKIYVAGGESFDFFSSRPQESLYIYDLATNSWSVGATFPAKLSGVAMAAHNGKLYTFGGWTGVIESDQVFEYDPNGGVWTAKAPMPGGTRRYAAAATLGGKIYVVGGWPDLNRVDVYDPATNSWAAAPPTNFGRQSPGLTTGPDGFLYLAGGGKRWDGVAVAERFNPTAAGWEILSTVNDANRAGASAAFAAGRVYLAGGRNSSRTNESLTLDTSFCLSQMTADSPIAQPLDKIVYTVEIQADGKSDLNASITAPIPNETTFGEFGINGAGARFNSATNRVEWQGALTASSAPQTFSYSVNLKDRNWNGGEIIASTATFASVTVNGQPGQVFTRTVQSPVFLPDFANSTLTANRAAAIQNETLDYLVHLESRTAAGGPITLRNPVPAGLEFVPDSLNYNTGSGKYDADLRTIFWSGSVRSGPQTYINFGNEYEWGDSEQQYSALADKFAVDYAWIDIAESGAKAVDGDERTLCDLPIGFAFPFYGAEQNTFCVNTNGFITFDPNGSADYANICPLPNLGFKQSMIAALWDDLFVENGVYYQTVGQAPNRALVVQWVDALHYFGVSLEYANFEIILYENGLIKLQFKDAGGELGIRSTTGLGDNTGQRGTTYACNAEDSLQDALAVLFVPPDGGVGSAATDVSYKLRVAADAPVNAQITNTAHITSSRNSFTRAVTTSVNPLSLSTSAIELSNEQVPVGGRVEVRFLLRNTGLLTATNASLLHTTPPELTYVVDSVQCTVGACTFQNSQVRWNGPIAPGGAVAVLYQAILSAPLPDRTPVSTTAQVNDGHGATYDLVYEFLARSSDLSTSRVNLYLPFVEPGGAAGIEFYVRNSGAVATTATVSMTLPAELTYIEGSLACASGECTLQNGVLHWTGLVEPRSAVLIRLRLQTLADAAYGAQYLINAAIEDGTRREVRQFALRLGIAHNRHFAIMMAPPAERLIFLPIAGK